MSRKPFEVKDSALWHEVAQSVRPFGARNFKSSAPASHVLRGLPHVMAQPRAQVAVPARSAPDLTGFDRRTEQKMVRGQVEIDDRIDLHGHGVELARVALLNFVSSRRASGARLVLVITGKGGSPLAAGHALHGRHSFHAPERAGRLRREVPEWLHEPQFRDHVIGFQQAHPRHGGGGALYVKLRRVR
jgi:DNA-nicking Smr family endonuclease